MSSAAKSVYYFGIYLVITGITIVVAPNMMLSMLQLPETNEIWLRVAGVLVINIGVLYFYMAPTEHKLFFALSAYLRATVMVWFVLFVAFGWAAPALLVFGVVDLAGAIWTYAALKRA
jgi:uncharacterized membrane protein HdeD (DUF308 family)